MRLLALATYSDLVASTRFRVTQWIPYLERAGVAVDFVAFLRDEDVRALYRPGTFAKARSLIAASFRQLTLLAGARGYDGVFVQRGAALIGPPLAEFISRSVYGLPLIFDLDDAIWELDLGRSRNPLAARLLKNPRKVFWLRDAADLVVAGSSYLAR